MTIPDEDNCAVTRAPARGDFAWESELKRIAASHGVTLDALRGKNKFRILVHARWDCYRYLYRVRGWSTPQIGKYFNRDHTTIMHGLLSDDDRERVVKFKALKKRLARQFGDR